MTDVEVLPAMDLAPELESFRKNARHNATSSVLVVDGLPVVSAEKADKLLAALSKIFAKVGQLRYPSEDVGDGSGAADGSSGRPPIVIPRDEAGSTLGFALVEYVDAEQAAIAAVATNRFQFGRSNTFDVMNAADVLRICSVADEFTPPPEPPVANIVAEKRINLKGWLLEPRGREQFAVRHGLETDVMWHDPVLPIEKVRNGGRCGVEVGKGGSGWCGWVWARRWGRGGRGARRNERAADRPDTDAPSENRWWSWGGGVVVGTTREVVVVGVGFV